MLGLSGLATDVQTLSQLLRYRVNMYNLTEEREIGMRACAGGANERIRKQDV